MRNILDDYELGLARKKKEEIMKLEYEEEIEKQINEMMMKSLQLE